MSESKSQTLSGVAETLLITLYLRAMESQRPDALIKDEKAVALVAQMSYDFDRIRQIPMSEANNVTVILRNREFDRYARDFLSRHPEAVVVHIGCGLDSRFERVDNGQVEWYDLDLPDVIELRRKIIGDEGERYHLLGCSVLDNAWLDKVSAHHQHPFLFLAEGVFMYFKEAQVKSLVLTLHDHFPCAELVFDIFSPLHVWRSNLQWSKTKFDVRLHWGIWHGQEIERWGDGIRLLGEWGFFDRPEPRLTHIRWLRPIESLARTMRIYHFCLGKLAELK
ncbi:MAG: class I SAM-dependent methyltransferase [Candidatus Bathyarchaeota archaeon]|nr:class I SAM-dependent methyltransferase [Candidatus Bathyarchaeota archaeon]